MLEGPYELPEGWRWVRLGEVCEPTERRDPSRDPEREFLYVDISSVDNSEGKVVSPKTLQEEFATAFADGYHISLNSGTPQVHRLHR